MQRHRTRTAPRRHRALTGTMLDGTIFTGATLDRIALDDITALPLTPAALPPALTPTSRVLPCKADMRLLPHAFIPPRGKVSACSAGSHGSGLRGSDLLECADSWGAPRNSRILTKIRKFAALGSDLGVHDRYSATYSS
jgi:hypothetical protein